MTFSEKFNELLGIKEHYRAPDRLMEVLYNREEREELFRELLEFMDYDIEYDWFHQYFQDEHANRKKLKQDFTPPSVSKLMVEIIGREPGTIYEPAAGTGGILIERWNATRVEDGFFRYSPADYLYVAEEISSRTIPFLAFNLMIRGMNAIIMNVDTLSRKSKGILFIQNFHNDSLGFSDLNVLPYTKEVEQEFGVEFVEQEYRDHIERSWYDEIATDKSKLSPHGLEMVGLLEEMIKDES